MNLLCVIPARGGSERIPKKNKQRLGGKTLVELAFECAFKASIFDQIVVSTDEPDIAEGYPFVLRPNEISGPKSDISEAVRHAMLEIERQKKIEFDYVVTLQPAIPIRKPELIRSLVDRVIANGCGGGVTGVEVVPWLWSEERGEATNSWFPEPYPRSQEFKGIRKWQEINSVQVASRKNVVAGKRWDLPLAIELMPSYAIIDIDTLEDLHSAQIVFPYIYEAYMKDNKCDGFILQSINGLHTNVAKE